MSVKPFFTKEEMAEVLKAGNDERHNSLIVTFDGTVQLVPFTRDIKDYAVRYETFAAGNSYVGEKSQLNHLDRTYQGMLEGWVEFLGQGKENREGIYKDYATYESTVEELQRKAQKLVSM